MRNDQIKLIRETGYTVGRNGWERALGKFAEQPPEFVARRQRVSEASGKFGPDAP
jgi:hypothetical protein